MGQESVDKLQSKITHVTLKPGDFAENILVKGITLYELPVGYPAEDRPLRPWAR